MLTERQIIDHDRYPIDEVDSDLRAAVVEQVRRELDDDGCAVVKGFLSPAGHRLLLTEAAERSANAYFSPSKECNVYLGDGDPGLGKDHPRNIFMERTNGFVTADTFGLGTGSRRLYDWRPLTVFLADCLGKDELHVYEDPVSNMIVNVARPGQRFNWHFDTNEFTITMLLKAAGSGGHFEYVPGLRNPDDECYEDVKAVLDGDRSRVRRLDLAEGDLQFFLGRFSLHQVTPNGGDSDRLLLIMSFSERPGMVGSRSRVQDLYGKVTEVHTERESLVRADQLLD